jgi:hypothetical protein
MRFSFKRKTKKQLESDALSESINNLNQLKQE